MGWETRGGRRYYYRKRRIGGAVRSVYVHEFSAGLVEALAAQDRDYAAQVRQAVAAEREEGARDAGACRALRGEVRDLLLAAGFHQHKREWRRRRMTMAKARYCSRGRICRHSLPQLALHKASIVRGE